MDFPIGFKHLASLNHALALQIIEIPALGIPDLSDMMSARATRRANRNDYAASALVENVYALTSNHTRKSRSGFTGPGPLLCPITDRLRQHRRESIEMCGRKLNLAITISSSIEYQGFLSPHQADGIRILVSPLGKQSHVGCPIESQKDQISSQVRVLRRVTPPVVPRSLGIKLCRMSTDARILIVRAGPAQQSDRYQSET
ncbi:MAG: hypothetical protein GAK33_00120 [Burkholderia lata]|uniref:Uncharacterized protein n=1 Tax=Burkholderia lata (strain ATCC 17760 / DSM 23089 / LMG 22485 / NCIMB 9086 / R18194 / 383) TaxID=482957 RepID=A0A833PZ98_BURL3|nr:MAG: hypothetical protein GAK33_00120 [Burkholderia lata]